MVVVSEYRSPPGWRVLAETVHRITVSLTKTGNKNRIERLFVRDP